MALNVEDKIATLDPARRRKVEDRAAELIAEEMTLRELRKARQLTQARVAHQLGISQDGVSRLEQRSDLFALDVAQDGGGYGGQPFAHRQISRPSAGRAVRHCRWRSPRLISEVT